MKRFAATMFAVICAIPAFAQDAAPRSRFPFGPELGFFIPTSSRTRAAFGETWVNYGVGLRPIELPTQKGTVGFDLNVISTRSGGRKATIIPAAALYKRSIGGGEPGKGISPYIGATAGVFIADLRSDNYGVTSGYRGGFGSSALIGVTYQTNAYLQARYQVFSKVKGFDLSGVSFSAGYRF